MNNMKNDDLSNESGDEKNTEETKPKEKFTKPVRDGLVEYIEIDVDKFNFDGYEVVRRELFSKVNCPAVTIKYGSVVFNVRAIRKLDECSHIQILINSEKKLIIAKPCDEDDKDSLQWSRIDKHGKVVPRAIKGKAFTAQLFEDMKWDLEATFKMLGTLLKCKNEKMFIFDLNNTEAYSHLSVPSADNPNRRERVPLPMPEHWQGHYGKSYEESKVQIVKTLEDMPEGFVKITIPQLPLKKTADDEVAKVVEATKYDDLVDDLTKLNEPKEGTKEEPKDETK
jgi:hypothetical protein